MLPANLPTCQLPPDPHQPKVDALVNWMDDLARRSVEASLAATKQNSPHDHLVEQISHLTEAVLLLARVMLFGMAEVHGKENGR